MIAHCTWRIHMNIALQRIALQRIHMNTRIALQPKLKRFSVFIWIHALRFSVSNCVFIWIYALRFSFGTCTTWLIHVCEMTHSYVWHDSLLSDMPHPYMTLLVNLWHCFGQDSKLNWLTVLPLSPLPLRKETYLFLSKTTNERHLKCIIFWLFSHVFFLIFFACGETDPSQLPSREEPHSYLWKETYEKHLRSFPFFLCTRWNWLTVPFPSQLPECGLPSRLGTSSNSAARWCVTGMQENVFCCSYFY